MRQAQLFAPSIESIHVPGFSLITDFITPEEERTLLAEIDRGTWRSDYRRRIQQYGLGYGVQRGKAPRWVGDFPAWLCTLAARVQQVAPLERFPENCVINEYIPPQGIAPHQDYDDFGDAVACVSLGSDIVMDLTHPECGLKNAIHVPRRSFWVIRGEARWVWKHGIAPRLYDVVDGERVQRERRVSITFRTARVPL